MSDTSVAHALEADVANRGLALLSMPEDQWFDRKGPRTSPRDLANLEIGMANAEGGTIVVGLQEGKVLGVDSEPTKVNGLRQAAMDLTTPVVPARARLVECVRHDGQPDHLLVIDVETSSQVHASTKDEVHLRVGDENRKLTFAQRQELIFDKGQASFDATPARGANEADLDQRLLTEYAHALAHSDPSRLLVARGLRSAAGELSVASVLLFGREPQRLFPEAYVRVVRYLGVDRKTGAEQNKTFDERCEGPIPYQLDRARERTRTQQPAREALGRGGRFERQGLIPEDAWLEGIVNAVIHRSYSLGGDHIRVEIFDNRIEIESPGRFPGLVDPERPESITRFARNPRIARACSDLRIGQELGEGIRRIYEQMRVAGLEPPLYKQTQGSVRLILSADPLDERLERELPSGSRRILDAIRAAGGLGTGELSELFELARPTMLTRLKALEKVGLVRWVGKSPKDPRARWTLP
jgi:ATP-dependent DNA helicase RecG